MSKSWAGIEIERVKKEFPKKMGKMTKNHLIWALAGRLAKLKRLKRIK